MASASDLIKTVLQYVARRFLLDLYGILFDGIKNRYNITTSEIISFGNHRKRYDNGREYLQSRLRVCKITVNQSIGGMCGTK